VLCGACRGVQLCGRGDVGLRGLGASRGIRGRFCVYDLCGAKCAG
jgi:hypothetical protein